MNSTTDEKAPARTGAEEGRGGDAAKHEEIVRSLSHQNAQSYLDRGWRVVPIPARSKGPVIKGWGDLRLDADDLPKHFNGNQNVGLLLGEPSGWLIDVDVDRPEASLLATELLPETGAIFGRQSNPWSHFLYRAEEINTQKFKLPKGWDDEKETVVEIRSTGCQTVAPGSVHPSGEPVRWDSKGEPESVPADELIRAVKKLHKAALEIFVIRSAMLRISPNNYDDWFRVGLALYSWQGARKWQGNIGFGLWDEWSRTSVKYNADEMAGKWESFAIPPTSSRGPITLGSLFHLAKENGWEKLPKQDYYLPGNFAQGDDNAPIVTADVEQPTIITKKTPRPWRGVTDDQVRECIAGSALEPIVDALTAPMVPGLPITMTLPKAIALAGCALSKMKDDCAHLPGGIHLARNIIMTAGGQGLNAWAINVAPSAGGKDVGGVVNQLAFGRGYMIGDGGSAEGLADALVENGNGIIQIREMMNWLDQRHWQYKAASFLTGAFSSGMFHTHLSKRGGGSAARKCDFCFPSITANIQPQTLEKYGTSIDISSGFLARFLFAYSDPHYGRPTCNDFSRLVSEADQCLIQYESKQGVVEVGDGYLGDVFRMFETNQACLPSVWMRLVNEYGPRLAAMISVRPGDHGGRIIIDDAAWARAAILVQWFFAHAEMLLATVDEDSESKAFESLIRRILKFIQANPGCNTADISRNRGKSSKAKVRTEAIAELVHRGQVRTEQGRFYAI